MIKTYRGQPVKVSGDNLAITIEKPLIASKTASFSISDKLYSDIKYNNKSLLVRFPFRDKILEYLLNKSNKPQFMETKRSKFPGGRNYYLYWFNVKLPCDEEDVQLMLI